MDALQLITEEEATVDNLVRGLLSVKEGPLFALAVLNTFSCLSDKDPKEDDDYWWSWEPETIRSLLHPFAPTHYQMDVIMAVASVCAQSLATDAAHIHWNEPDVFGDLCATLTHSTGNHAFFQKPRWWQIGLTLLFLESVSVYIEPEDDVYMYMAICCIDHGLVFVPGKKKLIESMRIVTNDEADRLSMEVEKHWTDQDKRKQILRNPNEDSPLYIQIARLEASRQMMRDWMQKNIAQEKLLKGRVKP